MKNINNILHGFKMKSFKTRLRKANFRQLNKNKLTNYANLKKKLIFQFSSTSFTPHALSLFFLLLHQNDMHNFLASVCNIFLLLTIKFISVIYHSLSLSPCCFHHSRRFLISFSF